MKSTALDADDAWYRDDFWVHQRQAWAIFAVPVFLASALLFAVGHRQAR